MFEPHHQRYLVRLWQTQKEHDVTKRGEPWFYLVLAVCGAGMLFNPFPEWQLADMSKLIAITYVLTTTLSYSILWTMASPANAMKWELEKVFDRGMVEMAVEPFWRDALRYLVILGVAAGLWHMDSIWASALSLIWLTMRVELKQRWKMVIAHRLAEIPNS
jgi:hypothetical protein